MCREITPMLIKIPPRRSHGSLRGGVFCSRSESFPTGLADHRDAAGDTPGTERIADVRIARGSEEASVGLRREFPPEVRARPADDTGDGVRRAARRLVHIGRDDDPTAGSADPGQLPRVLVSSSAQMERSAAALWSASRANSCTQRTRRGRASDASSAARASFPSRAAAHRRQAPPPSRVPLLRAGSPIRRSDCAF